jgi:hypothetical protein
MPQYSSMVQQLLELHKFEECCSSALEAQEERSEYELVKLILSKMDISTIRVSLLRHPPFNGNNVISTAYTAAQVLHSLMTAKLTRHDVGKQT